MANTRRAVDPRIEQAILLITTRFRDPLTLSVLAAVLELSPFHLHRLFKAQTGQTPAAYLNRVRLDHASHLMVVLPDAPLVQIAIESGFSSAATFSRTFRQHLGQTATAFRERKRLAVNSVTPSPPLSLQRLPPRELRVQRCALDEAALTAAYRALAGRSSDPQRIALGLFVDAPFHQDRAVCRHFLALEAESCTDPVQSMHLPGGLYASLRVHGDIDALSQAILRFKVEQLDPSPYAIASTLAFERIALPAQADSFDYRQCAREVFIKVRRKHEPAL